MSSIANQKSKKSKIFSKISWKSWICMVNWDQRKHRMEKFRTKSFFFPFETYAGLSADIMMSSDRKFSSIGDHPRYFKIISRYLGIILEILDLYGDLGPAETPKGESTIQIVLFSVQSRLETICSHNGDVGSGNFLHKQARNRTQDIPR